MAEAITKDVLFHNCIMCRDRSV